jgi:CubicO group peptidase (beta-lactamase class C family)
LAIIEKMNVKTNLNLHVFFVSFVVLCLSGCVGDTSSVTQVPPEQQAKDAKAAQLAVDNPAQILFWSPEQQLYGYKNIDKIYPTRNVSASSSPYPLTAAPRDLLSLTYQLEGQTYSIAEYVETHRTVGLIVVQDDQVLLENYSLGNDASTRWMSFSIAKSVTSLLIGAAIHDGYILSVDERVTKYLPRLANTAYDQTTIKDLLNMASGVAWNEDYTDPNSDASHVGGLDGVALFEYLGKLPNASAPGVTFNYSTGETNLVGAVLRAAIGNNAATYLQQKIWQPFGMEADANWRLNTPGGAERGGCCLSATLRDYARIGLYAMRNGEPKSGESVLPPGWIQESTQPSAAYPGFGYLWWLADDNSYSARGIFGQMIVVVPQEKLVIAMQSAWPDAVGNDLSAHRAAVVQAIRTELLRDQ